MVQIVIQEETSTFNDMATLLRNIANQIENGNTSGFNPTWSVKDTSERDSKIAFIKKTLSEWGMTSTAELMLDSSPVYQNMNGRVCSLVEEFTEDYVRVVTYDDELIISEDNIPYEDLDDDLIDEINGIMETYDAEQEKLFDSIKDEDL